jgi:hypothetical protein
MGSVRHHVRQPDFALFVQSGMALPVVVTQM